MTPADVVRAAIPGADDSTVEHVIWGRTSFPFKPMTPRTLYKAARSWRRACENNIQFCDHCHRVAEPGLYECTGCREALGAVRDRP